MNIALIKLYLVDRHKFFILENMKGPAELQGGNAICARYLTIEPKDTESTIADKIAEIHPIADDKHRMFMFYMLDNNKLRYGYHTI